MMGILIIVIPLSIYLIAALTVKKSEVKHPDDYFAAFKRVGKTEFASSSIAYGFQVSTIYPFLFWGAAMFLFVPFVNAIFMGIGIILFYLSYNKISRFLGSGKTLPGLIGESYGKGAGIISSLLTIVGFIGYIIAELWFGSRILLSVFPNNNWIYISCFVFVIFIAFYLFKAGQISSIKTDQLQLVFTYVGVFGIIVYLLYLLFSKGTFINGPLTWGLIIISILTPIILFIRKARFISFNTTINKIINTIITIFFISILILSFLILCKNQKNFLIQDLLNLEGFGYAGLISLMILPLSWQFVDLTNWQRLLSVKTTNNNQVINNNIKKGLINFSIESPFTWILFIVLGLLITASFPNWSFEDILIGFPTELINSNILLEQVLGYAFVVSIISIMLSTIDSFIMGISFTYTYDLNPMSKKLLEGKINQSTTTQILKQGKYFGFIVVLISLVLFVFFDNNIKGGGELFINLLLTFYSSTLAFLPLVIGIIFFKIKPSNFWAVMSMLIGALCGIGIGVYAVLYNPTYAWYPIIICITLSFIIYFIGYIIKRNGYKKILSGFYKSNKTYCWLMAITLLIIGVGNYYYLFYKESEFTKAGKVWEMASCVLTFIYTGWLWYISNIGDKILDGIHQDFRNRTTRMILLAETFLLFVIVIDIICIFNSSQHPILGYTSIALVIIIFILFVWIDRLIIKHHTNESIKSDFRYGLKNTDYPSLIAFSVLFIYALVTYSSMEVFFSGAIAFQLLISSFIWANLETV